jgi:pimeloyl-ACP methyl ester carboxylesterase
VGCFALPFQLLRARRRTGSRSQTRSSRSRLAFAHHPTSFPALFTPHGQAGHKALKSTVKVTRAAVRQGNKAVQQTSKAVRETRKALRAQEGEQTPRSPGRFVEVDGLRVHYIARGKGRPVVLIHGNGTMAEDFVICGLVDRLAERYRVIAIDRPGFGHTDRPRHRVWTASAQAHLVHRVLERLNVEQPVIVGHSWGTLVTLALAIGRLRELRGLVLLSGYYYPTYRADVALSAPLAIPGIGDAARALAPQALNHILAPPVFRHVFWPQPVPARFRARFPVEIAVDPVQQRASAEDTATLNAAAALLQPHYSRLRMPLAIMTGDADAIVDARDHSCQLHRQVTNSTLTLLPGLGQMIHYTARGQIGRAVDGLMALARKPSKPPKRPSLTTFAGGALRS